MWWTTQEMTDNSKYCVFFDLFFIWSTAPWKSNKTKNKPETTKPAKIKTHILNTEELNCDRPTVHMFQNGVTQD